MSQEELDIMEELKKMTSTERTKTLTAMLMIQTMLENNLLTDEEFNMFLKRNIETRNKIEKYIKENLKKKGKI